MGTELLARGVPTPLPGWSAHALLTAPDVVARIHADYAAAGATVHTANTFRTTPRAIGSAWPDLARRAVRLARDAIPPGHRVAGSIAPLEDCYRPDLSPARRNPDATEAEFRQIAHVLAQAGCDLILCETFPEPAEALLALRAALATGLIVWVSLTAGPGADLLSPHQLRAAAAQLARAGAHAVLVNCVPAVRTLEFVRALTRLHVPFGAYANAGSPDDRLGWTGPAHDPHAADRYADLARTWVDAGATIIGGCCGTGPAHIRALARRFTSHPPTP